MACNCVPNVIQTTPNNPCKDCLKVVSLRYLCSDGPAPCGDTLVEDLATYNDVTACDCGSAVYSIESFDSEVFASVTITGAGVMTATTHASNYVKGAESLIVYKVDCPCSLLSATGNIYVCKEDLCGSTTCNPGEYCDPCDGTCKAANSDLDIDDGGVIAYKDGGTGFA